VKVYFQGKALFGRSELESFRKIIGKEGMQIVFNPDLLYIEGKMRDSLEKQ
jgi:hypothetical protein